MAPRSHSYGHQITHVDGEWVYADTGRPVWQAEDRPCARCGRKAVQVDVGLLISRQPIDACIADIVKALNDAGVYTTTSCCGHGIRQGWIGLLDGRVLRIEETEAYRENERVRLVQREDG